MDCPYRIPPSGTPAHHHRLQSQHRYHNSSTSHYNPTDRHRRSQSRSQAHHRRYHSQSHHTSFRACSRSHYRDNRRPHRSSSCCQPLNMPAHCSHCNSPHQNPPLIEALQPIPEITADHTLSQPIGQLRIPYIRIHPIPEDSTEIHTIRGVQESP